VADAALKFRRYDDYYVPLLRLLGELQDGRGQTRTIQDAFWERYESCIPSEHLVTIRQGREEKWRNVLDWARKELKDRGLLEMPRHGEWRITQAGRDWLRLNPNATHFDRSPERMQGLPEKDIRPSTTRAVPLAPAGISLEMLEQTRQVMPPDQFRQIWGGIYDQILAEEQRKAITPVTDRFLAEKTRSIVQRVQDFLQGRSTESPKSEMVCDWIWLCYTLELFREGSALWQYVNKDEVNPWQYERTMKLSAACRARVSP
jgi:hypothetical protein